jgi:hypothetical protein
MDGFRVGLEKILVYGQDEREVVPAGIRLDDRLRRTVLLDCAQDGGVAVSRARRPAYVARVSGEQGEAHCLRSKGIW